MTRMVQVTQTYLINVDADTPDEAEEVAMEMLYSGKVDLRDPTSYTVKDHGKGSWDD